MEFSLHRKAEECLKLSMKVNENTEHTIFFYYSGHTRQVELNIHLNGWVADAGWDERIQCYLDDEWKPEANDRLNEMIDRLKELQL